VKGEAEQVEKLKKSKTKQLRAAAALYKRQLAAAAKVAWEKTKKVRNAEKAAKAERLAAARAQNSRKEMLQTLKNLHICPTARGQHHKRLYQ
jgi:hypothetical protein